MESGETIYVTNREGFRNWLEKHSAEASGIWLLISRAAGTETLTLDQAVEESICFGWTAGDSKTIDSEKSAQRFTPRAPGAPWSEDELERARKLIGEGLMTAAGLATLPEESTTKDAKGRRKD